MIKAMEDKVTAFSSGFAFSLSINAPWIWLQVQVPAPTAEYAATEAVVFAVKVVATLILGVIGGIAGMAGKDLYQSIKNRFSK